MSSGSWYLFFDSESPDLVISSHPVGDSVPTPSGRVPGFRMLEIGGPPGRACPAIVVTKAEAKAMGTVEGGGFTAGFLAGFTRL